MDWYMCGMNVRCHKALYIDMYKGLVLSDAVRKGTVFIDGHDSLIAWQMLCPSPPHTHTLYAFNFPPDFREHPLIYQESRQVTSGYVPMISGPWGNHTIPHKKHSTAQQGVQFTPEAFP